MDLDKAIKERRSIRSFTGKKPSKAQLLELVDAAIHAPSGCDIQGWRFVAIDDKNVLNQLVERGAATFLRKAPCAILLFYDNRTDNIEYRDDVQSASAAVQNLLLKAHSIGLGACWVNHLPKKKELQGIFSAPKYFEPMALVALGFPAAKPKPVQRKASAEALLAFNCFEFKAKAGHERKMLLLRRVLRKVYYLLPFRQHFKPVAERFEKKFD